MIFENLWINTLLLFGTFLFLLHKYMSRNYHYWEQRKIPFLPPKPFVGNFYDIIALKKNTGEFLAGLYNKMKEPFFGIYVLDTPFLIVKSPELIKHILVRDFNYFPDRTIASPEHDQLISNMLFLNKNPDWKIIRTKISPVFTSGKLKGMFPIISNIGEELVSYINNNLHEEFLEAKDVTAKYSTDVITKCAFGLNANSLKDDKAAFRQVGRDIFDFTYRNALVQTSYFFFPGFVKFFKLQFFKRYMSEFLREALWSTIKEREKSGIKCNDLIDFLIDLKGNKEFTEKVKFVGDRVLAQATQFFTAGFETTSSAISFTLFELSLNREIQNKLREEITSVVKEKGLNYDAVQDMKYLSMCISETLRKYPVLPFLDRRCMADYKIPGTDTIIEKGTPVYIPMFGLHYDPKYFPEPNKYDPERFADSSDHNVDGLSYIPFGEGPRICIGERFGLLGTKLGIIHVVMNFELNKTAKTIYPLEYEPKSFILQPKGGLPIKFTKLKTSS